VRTPELITDPAAWQARCLADRDAGARLALVPTMGYLHEGHVSLLREARRRAGDGGRALATIFVNPAQFGPNEDLSRYPRDLEGDLAKCAAAGIDRVLAPPDPALVFPADHETWVTVERASAGLCGASRPGHFRGVATVVAKLLNLTRPHVALFGEKDFQQLAVIRRLTRDLGFGIEIVGAPTLREPDGLALSSRNVRLGPQARRQATALVRALDEAEHRLVDGEHDRDALLAAVREAIARAPLARLDYAELRDPETLAPAPPQLDGPALLALAVHFAADPTGEGSPVRLIDNRVLVPPVRRSPLLPRRRVL
jgi:pantoate--beta-alanine ligase